MISFQSWIKSCTHFYIFAVSPTVVYSIQVSAVQPYSNKKNRSEWYVPGVYSLDKSKWESAHCRETTPFHVWNWNMLNKHKIIWKKSLGYDFLVTLQGFNKTVAG